MADRDRYFPSYEVAHLFVRSELVDRGLHPEDGERIIGERFVLVAEAHNGYRVQHERAFESEVAAEAFLAVVAGAVAQHRDLDLDHWFEIDPCYGSRAYERAEREIVERERRFDREGL